MKSHRYHYLDWLRILGMLAVFNFHCARFFDPFDWHVKNAAVDPLLTFVVEFLVLWIMPLFFLISGMSSYLFLQNKSWFAFLKSRFKRLLVPFVFGTFVLIPPQVYLERLSHGQFSASFFSFFPHYFDGWYAFGGNFAWMGLHLWYLEFLFVYSIIFLPLLLWISFISKSAQFQRFSFIFSNKWGLLLFCIPLIILEVFLDPDGLGMRSFGGWNIFQYMLFFLIGFMLSSSENFGKGLEKSRHLALVFAVITLISLDSFEASLGYVVSMAFRAGGAWFLLMSILGYSRKHLDFSNRFSVYGNEAVLPFYILHQTVIIIIGYFIIQLNWPAFVKFLVILCLSFYAIIFIYSGCIRRYRFLRILFGMKPVPTDFIQEK